MNRDALIGRHFRCQVGPTSSFCRNEGAPSAKAIEPALSHAQHAPEFPLRVPVWNIRI